MIDDFRVAVSSSDELAADICIAGAGAAGITLGLELARHSNLRVIIVEGGGFELPTPAELDLYKGSTGPMPYPLEVSRLRYFGGTTNHWGGWCRPLDDYDFAEKDYIPLSGWPITREQLWPYYARAHEICEIDSSEYELADLTPEQRSLLFEFPEQSGFRNAFFRFSPPTRFGRVYREQLAKADNVNVLLHANVVDLKAQSGHITAMTVADLAGKRTDIKAKQFVLALGGIENPRLLLNCNSVFPAGLGNHSDYVGRCFADHFGFRPGFGLAPANLKYFRVAASSGPLMPIISMTKEALLREKLLSFCIQLIPESPEGIYPPNALRNTGISRIEQTQEAWRYQLQFINEPAPNPDSRVTLTNDVDALGLRRLHLDWRINQQSLDNIGKIVRRLALYLGTQGWGRVQQTRIAAGEAVERISGGMHHMGTTRMAESPTDGVVDKHGQVFGIDNLYIAGSSVFPTVGYSNPTLTIIALALRMAERLAERLKKGV